MKFEAVALDDAIQQFIDDVGAVLYFGLCEKRCKAANVGDEDGGFCHTCFIGLGCTFTLEIKQAIKLVKTIGKVLTEKVPGTIRETHPLFLTNYHFQPSTSSWFQKLQPVSLQE
jgi:hypothetical protein